MDESTAENEANQKKCLPSNDKVKCPPGKDSARYMVNCIKKGDRICYSDYKALIVRKELSSNGSQENVSEDSIHSGESLYKNLTFDLCLNEEENEKCLAFWKSVMENNLKPIECTLLKPNYDKQELKKESIAVQNSKENLQNVVKTQRALSFEKRHTSSTNSKTPLPENQDIFQRVFKEVKKKKLDQMKLTIKQKCKTCGLLASMDENKILSGDEKLDRKHHLDQLINKKKKDGSKSSSECLTKGSYQDAENKPAKQVDQKKGQSQPKVKDNTAFSSEHLEVKQTDPPSKVPLTLNEKPTTDVDQNNLEPTNNQSKRPICCCQTQQCECKHEIVNALKKFGDRQCFCGFAKCTCKKGLYLTKEETEPTDNSEPLNNTENVHNISDQIEDKKQSTNNKEHGSNTFKQITDEKQNISKLKAIKGSDNTAENKDVVGKEGSSGHVMQVEGSLTVSQNTKGSVNSSLLYKQEPKQSNQTTSKDDRTTKPKYNTSNKDKIGGTVSSADTNITNKTSKTNGKKGSEKNNQGIIRSQDENDSTIKSESIGEKSKGTRHQQIVQTGIEQESNVTPVVKEKISMNFCMRNFAHDLALEMETDDDTQQQKKKTTATLEAKTSKTSSIRFSSDSNPHETGENKPANVLSQPVTEVPLSPEIKCPCGYSDCDCEPSKSKTSKKKGKKCICGCGHGHCQCEANKSIETIMKYMEAKYKTKKRKSNSSIVKTTDCSRCGCSNNTQLTTTNTESSLSDEQLATKGVCNCGFPDCDCPGVSAEPPALPPPVEDTQEQGQVKANKPEPEKEFNSIGVQCANVDSRQVLKRKYCYICGHYDCPCEMRKLFT